MAKLSELINKMNQQIQAHGDVECFDAEGYSINDIRVSNLSDHNFPADYNMPTQLCIISGGQ